MVFGFFVEYIVVFVSIVILVFFVKFEYFILLVSGVIVYISLKEFGVLSEGKKVLVIVVVGGTGQFVVQFVKKVKCYVIGICFFDEKCVFLKFIGCNRFINYNIEYVGIVLKREYFEGVDVVYEFVGGVMFDLAVDVLVIKGRLIVIGFIFGY